MDAPLVSICTLAYNHAPFIRQYFEGILMQKTSFTFELLIHDDASTDETADIIREYAARYPDVITPIYQTENQHSKGVPVTTRILFSKARGKYIATCDGDDYWIDPMKLQKQVDFLETHPEYSICGSRFRIKKDCQPELFEHDWMIKSMAKYPQGRTITLNDFFDHYLLSVLTICFRKESIEGIERYDLFRDDCLFTVALDRGKGFVFYEHFAVYRIHSAGIWIGKTVREQLQHHQKYMSAFYPDYEKKSKSLRKSYFRNITSLRFFELSESKHLIKDFLAIGQFALSGKADTFFYRMKFFLSLTWQYFIGYISKNLGKKTDKQNKQNTGYSNAEKHIV